MVHAQHMPISAACCMLFKQHGCCLQDGEAPRVAIVNQVGFHNEVYAALLWSFQRAGANATVFVEMEYTWAIQDVLRGWCAHAQSSVSQGLSARSAAQGSSLHRRAYHQYPIHVSLWLAMQP